MAIERLVPGTIEWESFYANHISRYSFAREHIDKDEFTNILDAACGVGYGSKFLSENPNFNVVGIDKSVEALKIAEKNFSNKNINFIEDDCETFSNSSLQKPFDIIVSFETLEHLKEPKLFLKNCFLNLKENGKLIISTPNKLVTSPDGKIEWKFHEKEYLPKELYELLVENGFSNIKIFGQQLTLIGKLKDQIRNELHKINSNPFLRIGKKIQILFNRYKLSALLPEYDEDFEIVLYENLDALTFQGKKGPFVLIAVCEKNNNITHHV